MYMHIHITIIYIYIYIYIHTHNKDVQGMRLIPTSDASRVDKPRPPRRVPGGSGLLKAQR